MADWSLLPTDILGEIALLLDQLEDLVYFSVVCQSWNHASSLIKPNWNSNNVTPWLLLAEKRHGNPDYYRKLHNITYNKSYQLKLPETSGLRCWGSPFGWIVILTLDFHVHLLNPLTNVRITNFPCVLTLDDDPYETDDDPKIQQWYFDYFVNRLVLLKMHKHNNRRPLEDGGGGDEDYDLVVAVLYILDDDRYHYLAVARPGDQAWTSIDDLVEDVVCLRDVIYILHFNGELAYCDMKRWCSSSSSSSGDLKDDVKIVDYVPKPFSVLFGLDKVCVLDLCGDLVMVQRKKKDYGKYPYYKTSYFNVFRLDNKEKKWVQIKDIGNYAIFVGNNTSMAVPISMAANNCARNSIYFTDDESMYWRKVYFTDDESMYWRKDVLGGRDMGVYNICSGNIIPFYQGADTLSAFCPPIFFKPNFS